MTRKKRWKTTAKKKRKKKGKINHLPCDKKEALCMEGRRWATLWGVGGWGWWWLEETGEYRNMKSVHFFCFWLTWKICVMISVRPLGHRWIASWTSGGPATHGKNFWSCTRYKHQTLHDGTMHRALPICSTLNDLDFISVMAASNSSIWKYVQIKRKLFYDR